MDAVLYKKYKDVELLETQVQMMADIVESDEAVKKTLLQLLQEVQRQLKEDEQPGLTIQQISEIVKINRPVRKKAKRASSATFEKEYTFIERKHAERVVNQLLMMSLCFYNLAGQAKIVNCTIRGKQVVAEIIKRHKQKGEE